MDRRNILSLVFFLSVSIFLGCGGGAEAARRMQAFRMLGLQHLEFCSANGSGPNDVDEFRVFKAPGMSFVAMNSGEEQTAIFEEIEDGEIVMVWNAILSDDANKNDKYVLAYEKSVPESGGIVVMGGGSALRLSAEEFAKMELMPTAEMEPKTGEGE